MQNHFIFKYLQLSVMLLLLSTLAGCRSGPKANEPIQVTAAKQEALKRGWKKVNVDDYFFRENVWHVHIWQPPVRVIGGDAWVHVSRDGHVIDFVFNGK